MSSGTPIFVISSLLNSEKKTFLDLIKKEMPKIESSEVTLNDEFVSFLNKQKNAPKHKKSDIIWALLPEGADGQDALDPFQHWADELENWEKLADTKGVINVVDASKFWENWDSEDDLAELICSQAEYASHILFINTKTTAADDLLKMKGLCRKLNSAAPLLDAGASGWTKGLLETESVDLEDLAMNPGWIAEMNDDTIEQISNVNSFVYRAHKPFHPQRFWDYIQEQGENVLRTRGFAWFATRPDFVTNWSQAGDSCECTPDGLWWADTPKAEWPEAPEELADIQSDWHEIVGDRKQQLVFVGQNLDVKKLETGLNLCLLTDQEFAQKEAHWATFEDPFPSWDIPEDNHHEHVHGPDCGHDHHGHDHHAPAAHVHGPDCGHDHHGHDHHEHSHQVSLLSAPELKSISKNELETYIEKILEIEDYDAAMPAQIELVQRLSVENDPAPLTMAQYRLALIFDDLKLSHRALPLWRAVLKDLETRNEPWLNCEMHFHYGNSLIEVGARGKSAEIMNQGLQYAEKNQLNTWIGGFHHELGILMEQTAPEKADIHFAEALNLREKLGEKATLGITCSEWAQAIYSRYQGNPISENSKETLVKSRDLFERAVISLDHAEGLEEELNNAKELLAETRAIILKEKLKSL